MKANSRILFLVAAGAALLLTAKVHAASTVNLLGDNGTLRVETYSPPAILSVALSNPYGAPPLASIEPVGRGGFALTFTPTSDFLATASNSSGGQTTTMNGRLDLLVTLAAPGRLTTNIFADGIWARSGSGAVDVTGGVTVAALNSSNLPVETFGNSFLPGETYNPSGTWGLFDQVGSSILAENYLSYRVSIDVTLIAEALGGQGSSSGYLAQKDFTVIFTTDGSSGFPAPPIPEPASLGMLGFASVALLARRRR